MLQWAREDVGRICLLNYGLIQISEGIDHQESSTGLTMERRKKVTAVVGTYRKGGVIDAAVDEILAAAKDEGAEIQKIDLPHKYIEFCTNCRACAQEPGQERGKCHIADDMAAILDEIETSDAIVLASPVNFGTVTAVMKRFIERLVCFAYWPWGMNGPKVRNKQKRKRAIVVVSSAAPSLMTRFLTQITGLLKKAAELLGAKTIGVLFIGLAGQEQNQQVSERIKKRARQLGKKLVST